MYFVVAVVLYFSLQAHLVLEGLEKQKNSLEKVETIPYWLFITDQFAF